MELKWLEDFLSLAVTRSFSRAAQERNVTQPAFSRRIRALEIWLGTDLLDRSVYPVALTPEGKQFLETAEEVVNALTAAKETFHGVNASGRGQTVAITALHTIAQSILPKWIAMLQDRLGPFTSRVLPDNFTTCLHALTDGGYDFFMTFYHPEVPINLSEQAYPFLSIGTDHLLPVAAPVLADRLARDGAALPLLQYSRGSFLGLLAKIAHGQQKSVPTYLSHINENSMAEALRAMARQGLGMAWLPQSLIEDDLALGRLVRLGEGFEMEIRLYRNLERARGFLDRIWQATAETRLD